MTSGNDPSLSVDRTASDVTTRVEAITQDADLSWVVDLLSVRRDEILTRWLQATPKCVNTASMQGYRHIPTFSVWAFISLNHSLAARTTANNSAYILCIIKSDRLEDPLS